jgi:hypothetical protein
MHRPNQDNIRAHSSVLWGHRYPDLIRSRSGGTCMGLHEVCDIGIQEAIPCGYERKC